MTDRAADTATFAALMDDPAPELASSLKAVGFAARHSYSKLRCFEFERAPAKANEVEIDVLFCGVCHSDIHQVKNEWNNTVYPCLPGHEIVGRISHTGGSVTKHQVGDLVGIGCMIDSCGACAPCQSGEENYCEGPNSWLATYNGPMIPADKSSGRVNSYGRDNTFGGYSNIVVVKENFALPIPHSLKPEVAAPILCAGVTTYSPMKHFGVKAGQQVGVVGFGGLGDLACKIAKAMGAEVTVFTRTREKMTEAKRLGVTAVLENDKESFWKLKGTFDFIISTVPEKHDINPFVELLKRDCTMCVVGALEPLEPVNNMETAFHRKRIAGSLIGSLADTQEILELCAKHGIGPDIELIDIADQACPNVGDSSIRKRLREKRKTCFQRC